MSVRSITLWSWVWCCYTTHRNSRVGFCSRHSRRVVLVMCDLMKLRINKSSLRIFMMPARDLCDLTRLLSWVPRVWGSRNLVRVCSASGMGTHRIVFDDTPRVYSKLWFLILVRILLQDNQHTCWCALDRVINTTRDVNASASLTDPKKGLRFETPKRAQNWGLHEILSSSRHYITSSTLHHIIKFIINVHHNTQIL